MRTAIAKEAGKMEKEFQRNSRGITVTFKSLQTEGVSG